MLTLKEKQSAIRECLDLDQIHVVRIAIEQHRIELEKQRKKEEPLGLDPHHIRARQRIIDGTDTEPGLLAIIAQHPSATETETVDETGDLFFDEGVARAREDADGNGVGPGTPDVGDEDIEECRVCGCTSLDCRQCIEATGEPCVWVQELETEEGPICSRCASAEDMAGSVNGVAETGDGLPGDGSNPPPSEPSNDADDWIPTPELVEEARVFLGKHVGGDWDELSTKLDDAGDAELARTVRYVGEHGWEAPTRPAAPAKGQKVKTTADRRKSYKVRKVFDDRVEVEWHGTPHRPFLALDELRWVSGLAGGCWVTGADLQPLQEEDQEDAADGPITPPWEDPGAPAEVQT